jgi:hypothetical protein
MSYIYKDFCFALAAEKRYDKHTDTISLKKL